MHIRWRGLELPSSITCDAKSLSSTYAKFVAEPFERGFGVTIGNSLRRILLSSLEGSAITQIKIHGAQHEFTTLPGVVEDSTDLVLNVKSLVVKNHSDSTRCYNCGERFSEDRDHPHPMRRPRRPPENAVRRSQAPTDFRPARASPAPARLLTAPVDAKYAPNVEFAPENPARWVASAARSLISPRSSNRAGSVGIPIC